MEHAAVTKLDFDRNQLITDPYPPLARLREQGPVHRVRHGDKDVWWIVGYDEARQAFSDRRFTVDYDTINELLEQDGDSAYSSPKPGVGPFNRDILNTDPPDHTRMRNIVRKRFGARQIEKVRPRVQEITDELIDAFAAQGEADLVDEFAMELSLRVICELLGVPADEARPVWTLPPRELSREEEDQLLLRQFQYNVDIVDRARPTVDLEVPEDDQPDVLSALIAAADAHGSLDREELLDMVDVLLTAATRGPGAMIASGLALLLIHPDQLELLQQRPELVPTAVEELLRYEGTEEIARNRVTLEDVAIGGVVIPKASRVDIFDSSANRDPRTFTDPDRLDITRDENRHIAFGHGIHFCLGAPLSRIEAQIAIGTLVRRLPDLELACTEEELLRWHRSPHVLGRLLPALPVRFSPQETPR
jgi:cytochrome P450